MLVWQASPHLHRGAFPKLNLEPMSTEGHFNYLSGHCSPQGDRGGGAEKSNIHSRSCKRRLVACQSNITAGHELAACSCGQAIDHGKDGDRVVPDQHHDLRDRYSHFTSMQHADRGSCDLTDFSEHLSHELAHQNLSIKPPTCITSSMKQTVESSSQLVPMRKDPIKAQGHGGGGESFT